VLELQRYVFSCVQLSLFPKSVLDVFVVVLDDDGSSYVCATNCAAYALAKSGVEMFDLLSCASIAVSKVDQVVVNPTGEEEKEVKMICTIGLIAGSGEVAGFELKTKDAAPVDRVDQLVEVGKSTCAEFMKIMRAQLKQEEEMRAMENDL